MLVSHINGYIASFKVVFPNTNSNKSDNFDGCDIATLSVSPHIISVS